MTKLLGYKRMNSSHPGKEPNIFISPNAVAAIVAIGEGQSNVVLTNGIAYEIAKTASEIAEDIAGYTSLTDIRPPEAAKKLKTFAQQQAEHLATKS